MKIYDPNERFMDWLLDWLLIVGWSVAAWMFLRTLGN